MSTPASSPSDLTCLVLTCTLKPSPADSSWQLLGSQVLAAFADLGVEGSMERVVDHDVRFGVTTDEGDGDAWPTLREKLLAADVLVVVTPIWLGQPSSVCKMVLERLDAELGGDRRRGPADHVRQGRRRRRRRQRGRRPPRGRRAASRRSATSGSRSRPSGATYWVGEAMQAVDYRDLPPTPEKTEARLVALARHATHLAQAC